MGKQDGKAGNAVRIVEKGNFTHARCDCGWRGPARRSRKKARADASAHQAHGCAAAKGK